MLSLKLDSNWESVIIPEAFERLGNIQTLIVDTTSRILKIRADVMKMAQLRHVKTIASTSLVKPSKDSKRGEILQTLSTMSPKSCRSELFDRASRLKVLGIRGKIAMFLDGKIGSFVVVWLHLIPERTNTKLNRLNFLTVYIYIC